MKRKPNLFVIGLPRSGTSSMHAYLGEHPRIFMSDPKETNYFAVKTHPSYVAARTEAEFLDIFAGATEEHLVLGETSNRYSLARESLERVRDFNPRAKIMLLVRNPIEAAQSLHSLLTSSAEEVEDLATAWDLMSRRAEGRSLPNPCWEPFMLQYASVVTAADKLALAWDVFGREAVKVVIFDDLKADTRAVYLDVLDFLDVPDDGRTEFPVHHPNRRVINKRLTKALNRPPEPIHRLAVYVREKTGVPYLGLGLILNWAREKLRPPSSRPELEAELVRRMADHFRPSVEELSRMLDRDLTGWLPPAAR